MSNGCKNGCYLTPKLNGVGVRLTEREGRGLPVGKRRGEESGSKNETGNLRLHTVIMRYVAVIRRSGMGISPDSLLMLGKNGHRGAGR